MKKKNGSLSSAIVSTLCYYQIFSYPLTVPELYKYVHYHKEISYRKLLFTLSKYPGMFETIGQYAVLSGDGKLIKKRTDKSAENKKKFAKAILISNMLSLVPTIRLIGVSGSLSMHNAQKHDDIDLFFITSKNSLWFTRFLVHLILIVFGEKRKRGGRFEKDKICPNMFMSEDALKIPKKKRNIYTAHEVAQLKVLISKDNTYQNFLFENSWVLSFLPNAFKKQKKYNRKKSVISFFFKPIDTLFFYLQFFYMKNKITHEQVSAKVIMFHPVPYAAIVQELLEIKIQTQKSQIRRTKREEKKVLEYAVN